MIRIVIVEDEMATAEDIKQMTCDLCPDIEVCGVYHDGETAVKMIQSIQPDAVLLDIDLPGMGGLEIAQTLMQMGKMPLIVFVTAYMDFAVQAFSVNALDYILKPVDKRSLARVFGKIKTRMAQENQGEIKSDAETCMRKITVDRGDRMDIVDCNDIRLIYGKNRQVYIMTKDEQVSKVRMTLHEFEDRLSKQKFFRCHRNYIVNVDEIKQITTWFKQRYLLILKGSKPMEIPVGRAYVANLRAHVEF